MNCAIRCRSLWGALLLLSTLSLSAPVLASSSVLVFGGTGRLGLDICKALEGAGHSVTVFARPSSNRDRLEGLKVNFVVGDVLNADDVRKAFETNRFDVVIDALSRGRAPAAFYATSMENIARAGADAEVKQIILHGSVGAGDSMVHFGDNFRGGMNRVMEAKTAGENALISSGVPYTIIRNWALKPHGTTPTSKARLSEDRQARGWVTRADLAQLTSQCLLAPECLNRIFHAVDDSLGKR